MEDVVNCHLCGRQLLPYLSDVVDPQTRQSFAIKHCPCCRHGRTSPVPASMAPYYGPQYHGGRHGLTNAYCVRRRIGIVTKAAGRGNGRRLLDVGCGDGSFLLRARQVGWKAFGTELNPRLARAVGLDVYTSLAQATARGPFDCITAWHVLEHFVDPGEELRRMAGLLAPNGVLCLAVPNAESRQARQFSRHWLHLDVPRHLHHFSQSSLERHLGQAGLQAQRWWHGELEYDLLGWSQSLLNRHLAEPNVFFELVTGRRSSMPRIAKFAHLSVGVLTTAFALLPTIWDKIWRQAGTLVVAANLPDTRRQK